CYFNTLPKVNDEVIAAWAQILRRTPDSRLVMENGGFDLTVVQQRVRTTFSRHGIGAERLEFHGRRHPTIADLMARFNDIDVTLDPFPYVGGSTTCTVLWMGVPVVTKAGEGIHARQGAAILSSAGFSDWVADSTAEYVDIATRLAGDVDLR